jgi:hypothetical protein
VSVIHEIAAKLAVLGLGTVGTTIFAGRMPNDPDECCAVYEYGGAAPTFGFGTPGLHFEEPAVQVAFRGPRPGPGVTTGYTGPRTKAEAAYRGLATVEVETLSGGSGSTSALYHYIRPQQAPLSIGEDEQKRVLIVVNFLCEKVPSEVVP